MSATVLSALSNSDTLYASTALIGSGGLASKGRVNALGSLTANDQIVISQTTPAAPSTLGLTRFSIDCSNFTGSGLVANTLQKFAYCDPSITPATIQEYERATYVATATAPVGAAVAPTAILVNKTLPTRAFVEGALIGTFTTGAAAVVVSCPGITAGSRIRMMLVGGSTGAWAAVAVGGLVPPTVTIQVGVNDGASTFTVSAADPAGSAGLIYAYEVLLG